MSTILKALRRLEQDKNVQSDRPLREAVTIAEPASRARASARFVSAPVLAGASAFVVALAVAVFFFARAGEDEAPPAAVAAAPRVVSDDVAGVAADRAERRAERRAARPSGPTESEEAPARPVRPAARRADGLSRSALQSDVAVVVRPPAGSILAEEPTPSPRTQPAPVAVAAAPAAQRPAPALPPPPAIETPAPKPIVRAPEPVPSPPPSAVDVAAAPPPVPAVPHPTPAPPPRAEKATGGAQVPDILVERTVWHPTAARRTALVTIPGENRSVEIREGDTLGPLVVSKIEPSGVVFVHEGVELRKRVGKTSWSLP